MREEYWEWAKCWRMDLVEREAGVPLVHHGVEKKHVVLQGVREGVAGLVVPLAEVRGRERRQRIQERVEEEKGVAGGLVVVKGVGLGDASCRQHALHHLVV